MKVRRKTNSFLSQNLELLAWSLILLVFVAGVAQLTRGQIDHETALGFSAHDLAGSPEIGQ